MTLFPFDAIALRTLRDYWPLFAAGALVQLWIVVKRMRHSRPFPPAWALTSAFASVLIAVALSAEPFLATQLANETVGEGAHAALSSDLQAHVHRSWPLAAALAVVLFALVRRPRSNVRAAGLAATASFLVSWMAAMWLFTTIHSPLVFRFLVIAGGLGIVASLAGIAAATAVWMAIGRWIWRQGRRRGGASRHDVQA